MIFAIAVLQLLFLGYYIYIGNKKQGLTFWVDPSKIFVLLWVTTICLYNFQFSGLYSPTLQINLIVMLIIAAIILILRKNSISSEEAVALLDEIDKENSYNTYYLVSNIIFFMAVPTFINNVLHYGLAILAENKIGKQPMEHYSSYIVYMLTLCAQIKYILYRNFKNKKDLAVLAISVLVLFLTLNRGPIAFLFTTIYIYEVIHFIKIKDRISKRKIYISISAAVLAMVIFLQLFAYVGNVRMEYALNKYNKTLQQHYKMSDYMPDSLVWVYMYLTSPMDNAAHAMGSQEVQFTYFNNLLYPFIKLSANIVGKGNEYRQWLNQRKTLSPHLAESVGLTADSFIVEAYQDLGYVGVLVYIGIYCGLIYFTMRLIRRKTDFSAVGAMVIYSNTLNLLLWSVFVNSLKIPILLLNIMAVVAVELNHKYKLLPRLYALIKKKVR
ncbi:oligosaccharide repeat unit polymerase [Clostridium thermarum]|uniref:oligosaccharide repeat unit polymerase n=1 Tax=Clostridium thermarum TaxID=1716543 RepID=UPI0013D18B4A|nr:oligosaccharide repeat unit polymerase [Clostridium thermarum]